MRSREEEDRERKQLFLSTDFSLETILQRAPSFKFIEENGNLTCLEAPSPRGLWTGDCEAKERRKFNKDTAKCTLQSGAGCPRGEHFQMSSHQGSQIKPALEGHKWLHSVVHKFPKQHFSHVEKGFKKVTTAGKEGSATSVERKKSSSHCQHQGRESQRLCSNSSA